MAGYTRQSTFTDGDVITAAHSNDEFDQVLAAFINTSGHKHDGTAAEGPVIGLIGDPGVATPLNKVVVDNTNNRVGLFVDAGGAGSSVEQLRFEDGVVAPVTDNDIDLGTSSVQFKDAFFNGTVTSDGLALPTTTVTDILDEDNMSSNSATALATQQSIKAYVDATVTAQDLDFQADSGGALNIDLDSETITFTGGTGIDTSGSGNAVTFAIDSTVATLTGSQTLTNKTLTSPILNTAVSGTAVLDEDNMASDSNTQLATQQSIKAYVDSSVAAIPTGDITSVVAGAGMTGGGTTGDVTLNVVGGTGITANADEITIDATVATLTGSQSLTNKTITSPVLNTGVSGTAVLDEDNMASDSNTQLATQQSIKAYVDSATAGLGSGDITAVVAGAGLTGGATSGSATLNVVGGTGITANADEITIDATVATLDGSQTLTNKTIDASQLSGTVANARLDAQLQDVAGLAVTNGGFIVGDGSNFVLETAGTARTSLGLGTAAVVDTGTSAGNAVILDGSSRLPAVDGSQLTNLPAAGATAGFAVAMAIAL